MTIREKLGQLMMFGFPGAQPGPEALRLIREYKAGNVVLFAHNLETPAQMRELCKTLRGLIETETGQPPIISIDQEGGVVARLPEGAVSFPSAMAVAATGQPENARLAALYTGRELAALGVNCNLAPVLDVNTNPHNPVIGVRSYGCSPAQAAPFALAAIQGHLQAGVLPVAKHFPGHGDTAVDSHLGLPRVEKTLDQLLECELEPYRQAIRQGVPAIMAAHILFPALEPNGLPASMSPAILTGLLRGRLGFEGLVVSDCLEMGAIQDHYGTPEGFVAGLRAGLDIGCVSHTPTLALRALELAEQAVQNGELPMARVDEAVRRVLACKKKFANATADWAEVGAPEHRAAAAAIMAGAITRLDGKGALPPVDEKALFVGCPAYRATFASSAPDDGRTFAQTLAGRFGAGFLVTPVQPAEADIQRALYVTQPGQTVVVGTYNAHLNQGQLALVNELCAAGRQVVAVALRNPYDLPLMSKRAWKLAAYEYTPLSFGAVEAVLRGASAPGQLRLAQN